MTDVESILLMLGLVSIGVLPTLPLFYVLWRDQKQLNARRLADQEPKAELPVAIIRRYK